jgi:hypothetical protein
VTQLAALVQVGPWQLPSELQANPLGHDDKVGTVHDPPTQVDFAVSIPLLQLAPGHILPPLAEQPPQLFGSVSVSVHVPLQTVMAGGVQPDAHA